MFNIGDKIRITHGACDRNCPYCPQVGNIHTITEVIGRGVYLDNGMYAAMGYIEPYVDTIKAVVPLPLPG